MSFTVEAVLGITFVLRAVRCVVRIKLQKEIIFLRVLLYCMTQIISPRTISSSIEMPETDSKTIYVDYIGRNYPPIPGVQNTCK